MGTVTTGWQDHGTFLRVYADIPLRRNGLPNHAAREAAEKLLQTLVPGAFDPIEPVPESVAKAAVRDNVVTMAHEHIEISESHPPVPIFEDDEIPGPRCANGLCLGD
jgi:hypothetical protein